MDKQLERRIAYNEKIMRGQNAPEADIEAMRQIMIQKYGAKERMPRMSMYGSVPGLPGRPQTFAEAQAQAETPTSEHIKHALPAIGATALTMAAPEAGFLPSVGLATLGGAGGKGFQQILSPETAPETISGRTKEMAKAGAIEGAYEVGGRAAYGAGKTLLKPVAGAIGKVLRTIKKAPEMEAGAKEAIEIIQGFRPPKQGKLGKIAGTTPYETVLTPGQATTSGIKDFLENVAQYGLGGGRLRQFKRGQQQLGEEVLDEFITGLRKSEFSPEEMGDFVIEAIGNKREAFNAIAKGKYQALDTKIGEAVVDVAPLHQFAESISEGKVAQDIGASETGKKIIDALVKDESLKGGQIGFMQAHDLRSRLLKEADMVSATNRKDVAIGLAKKLTGILDQQMQKAAQKQGGDALKLWRETNQFYKEGVAPFNKKLIRQLMNTDEAVAENVISKIFKPSTTTRELQYVKEVVGKETFDEMSAMWMKGAVNDSLKDGMVSATKLETQLKRIGDNNLKEMFSPEQLKTMKGLTNYLKLSQSKAGEGTGRIWVQLGQATALGTAVTGAVLMDSKAVSGTGVMILASPMVLAQLFTRPSFSRTLIHGMKLPKGSPQLVTLVARLNREIKNAEQEERKDTMKQAGPTRIPLPGAMFK